MSEWRQLPPVYSVGAGISFITLGFQSMLIEVDDLTFQEGGDAGFASGRGFIWHIESLHSTGESHRIIVYAVNGDFYRPSLMSCRVDPGAVIVVNMERSLGICWPIGSRLGL